MAYAVIRTDNMHGTDVRADLISAVATVDLQNGSIVAVKGFATGYRDVWAAEAPEATEKFTDLGIVASPEIFYDPRKRSLDEFVNEKGDLMRVYKLHDKDEFSVTAEALSGTPAKGSYVAPDGTYKLAASTSDTNAIGEIIAEETVGKYKYYVIRVIE